jgi:hypothetical protein
VRGGVRRGGENNHKRKSRGRGCEEEEDKKENRQKNDEKNDRIESEQGCSVSLLYCPLFLEFLDITCFKKQEQ